MTTLREKRAAYAQQLVETEQFDKAISLYNRMVADDPADVDALWKLGGLHLRRGEYAKALSANERIAEQHYRNGDRAEAATVYEVIWMLLARHARELRPGYTLVPERLGEILSEATDRDQALRTLDRLLAAHHDLDLARVAARLCLEREDRPSAASALAHLRRCFRVDSVDVVAASLAVQAFDQLGQQHKGTLVLKESARIAWRTGEHAIHNALVDALAARTLDDTVVDLASRRERVRSDLSITTRPDDSVTAVDVPTFDESFADYSVSQEISADDIEDISGELVSADDYSRVDIISEPGPTEPQQRSTLVDVPPMPAPPPSDDGASPIPLRRRIDQPPVAWDEEEMTPTEIDSSGN